MALLKEGFEFDCGHHYGLSGYFAHFSKPDPDTNATFHDWNHSGHASTLRGAVSMAARVARGEKVRIPPPEKFEVKT